MSSGTGHVYIARFFQERVVFIRQYYETASRPFVERKQKIEAHESPYNPLLTEEENGEPPFLDEWIEADESLHVLGYTCLSMLAAALHLYFKTWEKALGIPLSNSIKSTCKNKGWVAGYRSYFSENLNIRFDGSPTDLSVLEEIVLVRNRVQHPDEITDQRVTYSRNDIRALSRPFFVDEVERSLLTDVDKAESAWLSPPTIHVPAEKFVAAIVEVEQFVNWLEVEIVSRVYSRSDF